MKKEEKKSTCIGLCILISCEHDTHSHKTERMFSVIFFFFGSGARERNFFIGLFVHVFISCFSSLSLRAFDPVNNPDYFSAEEVCKARLLLFFGSVSRYKYFWSIKRALIIVWNVSGLYHTGNFFFFFWLFGEWIFGKWSLDNTPGEFFYCGGEREEKTWEISAFIRKTQPPSSEEN